MSMTMMFEEAGSERRRGPLALVCVALAKLLSLLRPDRLRAVLRLLSRGARPSTFDEARRSRAEICRASTAAAGMQCLVRSIAVFVLCRLRGHVPTWCTGFRVDPFAAHAWVEVDGAPVDEMPEVASYTRVVVVEPRGDGAGR
ncbi:lasso peptide biosynthesis B2 protein [uncultured Propionibacterium sp.]|uniref:lasso peptide biosynthesis B2 protein n=1 Tax=uncultured Propionibacterium sp. TaxID=218066 RepID=UPI00292F3182|nr:lasso peptide biosynthesis B2 protein [uncultured Propionibacterium sp.]